MKLIRLPLYLLLPAVTILGGGLFAAEQSRPNILWITCEDTNPSLGCYGDTYAVTPRLDAFAKESVRYTQAFAYTGACSPSRSCLITGVYPPRLGTHEMRSQSKLPPQIKGFPEYLRAAGYYASNNEKEDYQFEPDPEMWDDSSKHGHWRNRVPGQPFFAVFNLMVTHQSQIFADEKTWQKNTARLTPAQRRDPAKAPIPPIHPDTPEFRKEWARHYENITAMDYGAGDILDQLEQDGLADDTIVFFFSDNGTGMPGIKLWAWGHSMRVPFMVRVPKKWRHLATNSPGEITNRLVSFVDFAPTVLSLVGLDLPDYLQGTAFMGNAAGPARQLVFAGRDRVSEMFDTTRTVRDDSFQYLRNFRPQLPYSQYMSYSWQHASLQSWERLHLAGKLSGAPARFFTPHKAMEELYDVHTDPWQVHNLAGDPAYAGELARMRALLAGQMRTVGDLGLLPEYEMHLRSQGSTAYDIALNPKLNPLDELMRAADLANRMKPECLPELVKLLHASDSAVRWWGATGLLALGGDATPAKDELLAALDDPAPDVRLAAAEALARLGELDRALQTIDAALRIENVVVRLTALNVISRLGSLAKPLVPLVRQSKISDPDQKDIASYVGRMVDYLPGRINQ